MLMADLLRWEHNLRILIGFDVLRKLAFNEPLHSTMTVIC
jgi:hypothetical protein